MCSCLCFSKNKNSCMYLFYLHRIVSTVDGGVLLAAHIFTGPPGMMLTTRTTVETVNF